MGVVGEGEHPSRDRKLRQYSKLGMTFASLTAHANSAVARDNLLDTNVITELRKLGDGKAAARVAAWVSDRDAASFYISALTLMELEIGILRIERRDAVQGKRLRMWMDGHVLPEFLGRTLPVDSDVALKCARLHVPDPRAERDALIAATAIVHGMTVVTGNMADFATTGAEVIDPWAEA